MILAKQVAMPRGMAKVPETVLPSNASLLIIAKSFAAYGTVKRIASVKWHSKSCATEHLRLVITCGRFRV